MRTFAKRLTVAAVAALAFEMSLPAAGSGKCSALPGAADLQSLLKAAPGLTGAPLGGDAGGLFHGERMWGAIVNRDGEICAVAASQVWSLGQSNLFNPQFLAPPGGQGGGDLQIAGGLIFFGGGVPLYKNGAIIGGLGISGDTSCTDHEIAKRVRHAATLDPPACATVDDITYSSVDGATVNTHPLCPNTFRNGTFIGNEKVASGY